jgi:predicted GNAT superfamily acetyltransferase
MRPVIGGIANPRDLTEICFSKIKIVSTAIETQTITIRDLDRSAELREVERLQKEVWGCADLDVLPATMLAASRAVGAILIGAFDGPTMVGFVYGFPAQEDGTLGHHSHMLAVKSAYRNLGVGYKLKLAQREAVLQQAIDRITWTFDPLQSLNAYFNFAKLGVVAHTYKTNFYGEATSSFLHQVGTDRLWVTWALNSQRVGARLESCTRRTALAAAGALAVIQVGSQNSPQRNPPPKVLAEKHLIIEIPSDINDLQRRCPTVAIEWREATRWAFTEAMNRGYFVEEFYRTTVGDQSIGKYLLTHGG